jgi:hypothetical protein
VAAAFFILVGCTLDVTGINDYTPTPETIVTPTIQPPPAGGETFDPFYISSDPFLNCPNVTARVLHTTPEDIRSQAEPCGARGWLRFVGDSQLVAPFVNEKTATINGSRARVFRAEYSEIDVEWGFVKEAIELEGDACYIFKLGSLNNVQRVDGSDVNPRDIAVSFYLLTPGTTIDQLLTEPDRVLERVGTRHEFTNYSAYSEVIQPYWSDIDHIVNIVFGIDIVHPAYDATFEVNEFGMMLAPDGFCGR